MGEPSEPHFFGWFRGFLGDEILPNYIGIIKSHYKDPYKPTRIQWKVIKVFVFRASRGYLLDIYHVPWEFTLFFLEDGIPGLGQQWLKKAHGDRWKGPRNGTGCGDPF